VSCCWGQRYDEFDIIELLLAAYLLIITSCSLSLLKKDTHKPKQKKTAILYTIFFYVLFIVIFFYISFFPLGVHLIRTYSDCACVCITTNLRNYKNQNKKQPTRHHYSKKQKKKGVRFDPDIPQTIRLEFAKSNTKVSKPKQQNNSSPPAAAPHPTLLHPLTGREYFDIFFHFDYLV